MNEVFDLKDIQIVATLLLTALWTVILWRGFKALSPDRHFDVIRLRRLAAFMALWLTTVALFVGALAVDGLLSTDISRGVYAALRMVLFIVGLAILLSWSPQGWTESDEGDERRFRRGTEQPLDDDGSDSRIEP